MPEVFIKQRPVWHPSAWRLLREYSCVKYAQEYVPRTVNEILIEFPKTNVKISQQVTVSSTALEGTSLLALLHDPATYNLAIDVGLAALEALQSAEIKGRPFLLFSAIYKYVKGPLGQLGMTSRQNITRQQRHRLNLLMKHYMRDQSSSCLVHGDLHASHLIINKNPLSIGLIDLEVMHIGKAATNFAQLWIGYYYSSPILGAIFYSIYQRYYPNLITPQFDNDVLTELAFRCQNHIQVGMRAGNRSLEFAARNLLTQVLSGSSFEALCLESEK